MTAVRTRVQAGCFAVTASSQKILVLDRFKKITVVEVDNFSPLFTAMNISPENDIGTEHLLNACIVYAMSNELGVPPGVFMAGDAAIIAFCRTRISDDVEPSDHELLINELISSWQLISKHPLLKKYLKLGEFLQSEGPDCQFSPMGAFKLFARDYFTGCVRAFFDNNATSFDLLKEWTYLIFSNLRGVGYYQNRFLKSELFVKKVTKILNETGNLRQKVEAFLAKTKKEHEMFNAMWFVAVKGWVFIELDDVEDLIGADIGLTDLIEDRTSVGLKEELEEQLKELRKQLSWSDTEICPLVKHCDFSQVGEEIPIINKLMKEVMIYAICSYAKTHHIVLHPIVLTAPFPVYRQAGKGKHAEEQLMEQLLVESNLVSFAPFELFAIFQKAQSTALKDCVQQVINARASQEDFFNTFHRFGQLSLGTFAVMQAMNVLTFQYRRLNTLVNGGRLQPRFGLFLRGTNAQALPEAPPIAFIEAPAVPPHEDPAEALYETLNLQRQGGCSIQ